MKLQEIFESRSADLYHAVSIRYAVDQLKQNEIIATTTHRYWDNGNRYEKGDKNYRNFKWMKGISFSRNLKFCLQWNPIIYVFDQPKLQNKFKITPIKWGKRNEFEEFLILNKSNINVDGVEHVRYAQDQNIKLKGFIKFLKEVVLSKFYMDVLKQKDYQHIIDFLELNKIPYRII